MRDHKCCYRCRCKGGDDNSGCIVILLILILFQLAGCTSVTGPHEQPGAPTIEGAERITAAATLDTLEREYRRLQRGVYVSEHWYLCIVRESDEDEPDWSKVPEHKREEVRSRWQEANVDEAVFRLWGPQIPFYDEVLDVEVLFRERP